MGEIQNALKMFEKNGVVNESTRHQLQANLIPLLQFLHNLW